MEYFRQDRGPEAADTLLRALYASFQLLADQPLLGRARPEIRAGVRSFPVLSYIVLYTDFPAYVYVARVVHQRRDLRRALSEG